MGENILKVNLSMSWARVPNFFQLLFQKANAPTFPYHDKLLEILWWQHAIWSKSGDNQSQRSKRELVLVPLFLPKGLTLYSDNHRIVICGCRSERFCLHGALFNQIVKHSTCSMSTHIHRLHVLSLLYIANTPVFTFAPRWQWSLWVTLTHNIGIQSDLREGAVPWEKKKKKRTRGSREQVTRTESEHTQKKKKIKVWGEVCEKSR